MSDLFGIWLERGEAELGEPLSGKVVFPAADEKLLKVKAVTLRVFCSIHGSGNSESVTLLDTTVHQGPVEGPLELPFQFTLPERGPVSWQGRHVKMDWTVLATLDIPWAIDPKRTLEFKALPRRRR